MGGHERRATGSHGTAAEPSGSATRERPRCARVLQRSLREMPEDTLPSPIRRISMRTTHRIIAAAVTVSVLVGGCSKREASSGAIAETTAAAGTSATAALSPSASPDTIVRGTLSTVSDNMLMVTTPGGEVHIVLAQPVKVYERERGDLSRVTDHAFVGVTSVPEPNGGQRATEIHVFPEELRGLGEGSRPMAQSGAGRSTMTNGSVASSRMTNGTAQGATGGTMTVEYKGGSQQISVPSNVEVTLIAPTTTKLTTGANVIVPGKKQPDGSIQATMVMLAGGTPPAR